MSPWAWGILAATALLWPDRLSGPFDGIPLDRAAEALLVGLIFPILWTFHPRYLTTRLARTTIVLLLLWRACAAMLFVQDGWCVRFEPARPYVRDATGAPHAWDLRADWRAADPACSAIMTRPYANDREFPAWFFNLPPAVDNAWPEPQDRPPEATTVMRVRGYLTSGAAGDFDIEFGPGVRTTIAVDGRVVGVPLPLQPGVHQVALDATLIGTQWRMVPRWNGAALWSRGSAATATRSRPAVGWLRARSTARWLPLTVSVLLLFGWIASALSRVRSPAVYAWMIGMSLIIAWLVRADQMMAARGAIVALTAAVFVPIPPRLRNLSGAFLLVGVPWLAYIGTAAAPAIGRWVLYDVGNDYWTFQRFAYRIFLQGYWLEGGSPTFYFQPLYRWIAGALHIVFGDSSVGEWFWDGGCLLAGGLFAFRLARSFAGFRWGLVAAVLSLSVFNLSNASGLVGRGLSEVSSAGLLSAAALYAITSRGRRTIPAVVAGLLATLAFYTRLNNLLMALGLAIFALPLRLPVRLLIRPAAWWRRVSWRTAIVVPAVIGIGLLCFAWRTWYYTGVFSLFHGTQRYIVAIWQPDMPLKTVAYWIGYNVMMVLTANDPPRFDLYASPILIGACVAVLALLGVSRLRELPAAAVLFFFASIAGAFVARGWAYVGRFSVHVMPITCALAVCGAASLWHGARRPDRVKQPTESQDPARAG